MSYPLTEKTLELNITAELAHLGRQAVYRPYFIGFSQFQELTKGADTYYSTGAKIGFFQFKKGYPRSYFLTFYINNNVPHFNQHHTLCKTNSLSGACRYVFPMISTNKDVYTHRGNLLYWTAFISPQLFNTLIPPDTHHRVRMYYDGTWERHSEVKRGVWTNIFGMLPEESISLRKQVKQQSPEEQRDWVEKAFNSLELPNMEITLEALAREDVEEVFKQRSSFCMIFD